MAGKESLKFVDEENFDTFIKNGVVLVDFFAEWCAPCKMLTPILVELSRKMEGKVTIAKLDVDSAQNTAGTYRVTSVPTLILFKNGKEINRVVGLKDAETLQKMLTAAI